MNLSDAVIALFTVVGTVWGVWAWIVDRRDRRHKEQINEMCKTFWKTEERYQKLVDQLHDEVESMKKEIRALMVEIREDRVRTESLKEKFHEYVVRIDRMVERHDVELGKIIRVGKG